MTVTIPTSEAQYGYVVGRVIRALGDSADADDKPDAVAATGKVTFTPKATLGRTTDYSAFIVREKIDAPLDAEGNLVRYEGATPAGISLTVGAYKVEFALASGSIPSFEIEVTAGHTQAAPLDLVTAAPYVPPTGVTVNTMLVPADAVVGQVLSWSASGLDWVDMAAAAGGVSSVAGRTGAVVLSSADLTDAASLATDAELTAGLAGKADASHTHAPEDITGTAVVTTDPRLSDARTPTAHAHPISDVTGLQTALDGKAASGHTHAAADITSGTLTAARLPVASTTASGIVELATTAEASAGTDTTRAVTPAGVAAAIAGVGGGVTDHGALSGLADDDHPAYALADGTRGAFAAPLGADDNYVTDAEKVKLANLSGTNTGDQVLPTWSTLSGKPAVIAAGATQADARTAIGAGTSNLAIGTTGTTAAAGNRQATETAIGMVELATTAEAVTGTDPARVVTPAGLKAVADTKANATHPHTSADVTDFTEATQDVVGGMVAAAGGTYNDATGTITLPSGGGGASPQVIYPTAPWYGISLNVRGGSGVPGPNFNAQYFSRPVSFSSLSVLLATGAGDVIYRLTLWTPNGNTLTRVWDSGQFSVASTGEVRQVLPVPGSIPAGGFYVHVAKLAGTDRNWILSGQSDGFLPVRDRDNCGAVSVNGLGTLAPGWNPPSTVTVDAPWPIGGTPWLLGTDVVEG